MYTQSFISMERFIVMALACCVEKSWQATLSTSTETSPVTNTPNMFSISTEKTASSIMAQTSEEGNTTQLSTTADYSITVLPSSQSITTTLNLTTLSVTISTQSSAGITDYSSVHSPTTNAMTSSLSISAQSSTVDSNNTTIILSTSESAEPSTYSLTADTTRQDTSSFVSSSEPATSITMLTTKSSGITNTLSSLQSSIEISTRKTLYTSTVTHSPTQVTNNATEQSTTVMISSSTDFSSPHKNNTGTTLSKTDESHFSTSFSSSSTQDTSVRQSVSTMSSTVFQSKTTPVDTTPRGTENTLSHATNSTNIPPSTSQPYAPGELTLEQIVILVSSLVGVALIALLILAFVMYKRSHKKKTNLQNEETLATFWIQTPENDDRFMNRFSSSSYQVLAT